jgi:hypothetical protein
MTLFTRGRCAIREETMSTLGTTEELPVDYREAVQNANTTPLWPSMRKALPHDTPQSKACLWPLAIILAFLITTSTTSRARAEASSTYFGSGTARVTDDGMTIDRFDQTRFPDFALESLARYFKLGGPVKVNPRASSAGRVQDIELVGPSRCLATEISRAGWQKLRFEFEYQLDPEFLARTSRLRFEFLLRLVSGFVADFQQDREPPAERFKQIGPSALADIASKLAGFMRRELASACFDRPSLRYCPATAAEPCQ